VTSPFITTSELSDALNGPAVPAVLDASLVLHPAAFDGDYRLESARETWLESRIPGSVYVDVSKEFSDTSAPFHYTHPEPQAIIDRLAHLGVAEGRAVVIYDTTGTMWAARLWYLLRWVGVEARVLDGGLREWIARGGAVTAGEPPRITPVPTWKAQVRRDYWVSQQELVERSVADDRPLVCGLPARSFAGTDPTRYSRRGHIPGSVNVSSRDLFDKDGTVKSRVELVLAYNAAGVAVAENSPEVLLYCGGGISAAANALTLAAIGVRAVRIYDGSLEEWSLNPDLPLEITPEQ